jgi:hypothetical protein
MTNVLEVFTVSIIRVMEAISTSEKMVSIYQTTQYNIPEGSQLSTAQ